MDKTFAMILSLDKGQTAMLCSPYKNVFIRVIDDDYHFKSENKCEFIMIDEAEEWKKFTDKRIGQMDTYALVWWKENKKFVLDLHKKHCED